jgi:hypothetical protein
MSQERWTFPVLDDVEPAFVLAGYPGALSHAVLIHAVNPAASNEEVYSVEIPAICNETSPCSSSAAACYSCYYKLPCSDHHSHIFRISLVVYLACLPDLQDRVTQHGHL